MPFEGSERRDGPVRGNVVACARAVLWALWLVSGCGGGGW